MDLGLSGKRVVVTAGASGIGRHICRRFAEAGARIVTCDVDRAALDAFRAEHPGVTAIEADVAEEEAVARLFATADAALGGLDVLVNNAGIAGPTGTVDTLTLADWRRCQAVNIDGQFLCARAAVPRLRAAGGGAIVNLSSAAGRFAFPRRSAYAASKWAVVGFTKALARELGEDGIRVNAVCPGAVDGPRIRAVIAAKAASLGVPYPEMEATYTAQGSLGRLIPPEEVAALVVYLASALATTISGEAIGIDADTKMLH